MIKKSPEEIINAELNAGEKLLWSHVISHVEPLPQTGMKSKLLKLFSKWLNTILILVNVLFLIWWVMRTPREEFISSFKEQLPSFGVVVVILILLIFVLQRTKILQKLGQTTAHPIYRNCIITDRRVLLFNHHDPERQEFAPEDIVDFHMDYENGGHALRFKPRAKAKESVLIGIADFQAALAVLGPFRKAS